MSMSTMMVIADIENDMTMMKRYIKHEKKEHCRSQRENEK